MISAESTTQRIVMWQALLYFPTVGSPNPMLTGVALGRRTGFLLNENVLPGRTRSSARSRKLGFDRCSTERRRPSRTGASLARAAAGWCILTARW
jgi:hypothetical protein